MTPLTLVLWVIVPYVAITVFVLGHVWRYRYDKFGWTTRSSQLYEQRLLLGQPPLPLRDPGRPPRPRRRDPGPEGLDRGDRPSRGRVPRARRRTRHRRRVRHRRGHGHPHLPPPHRRPRLQRHHGQRQDHVRAARRDHRPRPGHDRARQHDRPPARLPGDGRPWFRSIFYLRPDGELMAGAPLGFQLHALAAWALFAFWPFSRLVHVFSAPIGYLFGQYIVYRSRDPRAGVRTARGWERAG